MKLAALIAGAWALSLGFILPADSVIRRMAQHRDEMGLYSLVVHGTLQLPPEEMQKAASALKIEPDAQLPFVATYKMPGRCKVELELPNGKEVPSATLSQGKVMAAGPELAQLSLYAQYVCPLLDQRGAAEIEKGTFAFVRQLGADPTANALGRTPSGIAYVIGGKGKETVPSLWIEKDHFWPVRVQAKGAQGTVDVALNDYASPVTGEWHPRVVELKQGDQLLGRFIAEKAEPNVKLPDSVF